MDPMGYINSHFHVISGVVLFFQCSWPSPAGQHFRGQICRMPRIWHDDSESFLPVPRPVGGLAAVSAVSGWGTDVGWLLGWLVASKKNVIWRSFVAYDLPIGSMYAIYGNIYHQYTPNVSIYIIHGSYGLWPWAAVKLQLTSFWEPYIHFWRI